MSLSVSHHIHIYSVDSLMSGVLLVSGVWCLVILVFSSSCRQERGKGSIVQTYLLVDNLGDAKDKNLPLIRERYGTVLV